MRPWREIAIEAEFPGSTAKYDSRYNDLLVEFDPTPALGERTPAVTYLWYYPDGVNQNTKLGLYHVEKDLHSGRPGVPGFWAAEAGIQSCLDAAMNPSAHLKLELIRTGMSTDVLGLDARTSPMWPEPTRASSPDLIMAGAGADLHSWRRTKEDPCG